MAPRIRLNIAKPLPTINEALEDIFEDVASNMKGSGNAYMNPNFYSSDDYHQSICQLARPTFPGLSENKIECQDVDKVARLHGSPSIFSLDGASRMVSWDEVTNTLPNFSLSGRKNFILDYIQTSSSSKVDPLEDLYTEAHRTQQSQCPNCRENSHVDCPQENFQESCLCAPQEDDKEKEGMGSFPRFPFLRPMKKENSCSELKALKNHIRMSTLKHGPNQKENVPLVVHGKSVWLHSDEEVLVDGKILKSPPRGQPLPREACTEREGLKPAVCNQNAKGKVSNRKGCVGNLYRDQNVTGRDWISEYQNAWKEAKVRAALLPPISES